MGLPKHQEQNGDHEGTDLLTLHYDGPLIPFLFTLWWGHLMPATYLPPLWLGFNWSRGICSFIARCVCSVCHWLEGGGAGSQLASAINRTARKKHCKSTCTKFELWPNIIDFWDNVWGDSVNYFTRNLHDIFFLLSSVDDSAMYIFSSLAVSKAKSRFKFLGKLLAKAVMDSRMVN